MTDGVVRNIRVVRDKLLDFKKRITTLSKLDQELKDSEMFLNIQISDLNEDFKSMKLLHTQIVADGTMDIPDFVSYSNDKVFQAIQNIFFKLSTSLHELLQKVCKSGGHDTTFTDFSQTTFHKLNSNISHNNGNLPSLDLNSLYLPGSVPTFHGSYDKWFEFKEAFLENVHENLSLTDSLKLRLLRSFLKDDALRVIKREFGDLNSAQYNLVWEKLTKRYNHRRTIVYSYFNVLLFQPSVDRETLDGIKSLYDTTYDTIESLKSLGLDCDSWGDFLLFIIYSKLPQRTKEIWDERHCKQDDLPKFSDFLEFLEQRFRMLESLQVSRINSNLFPKKPVQTNKKLSTFQISSSSNKDQSQSKSSGSNKFMCKCCGKGNHPLRKCFKFKKLKPQERLSVAESLNYCVNCLSFSHKVHECMSLGRCETCKEKHNNLLCLSNRSNDQGSEHNPNINPNLNNSNNNPLNTQNNTIPSTSDGRFSQISQNPRGQTMVSATKLHESVVFPTALVRVWNSVGQSVVLRAMIDACSDASYITEKAAQKLCLPVKNKMVLIAGLGDNTTAQSQGITSFKIQSLVNQSFVKQISAYVLKLISPNRPVKNFEISQSLNIAFADPSYKNSSQIDLLLGGDVDSAIFKEGSFKAENENIVFRDSELGWIVSGSVPIQHCFSSSVTNKADISSDSVQLVYKSLDDSIRRFWEIEEVPNNRSLSEEERLCETIYNATTIRLNSGQYSVCLPFKKEIQGFSNMRKIAFSRFYILEKRLNKNENLRKEYTECMEEYLKMGHMTEVDPSEFPGAYYIPHHCVIKESSSTTRLRVVFDASARDSNLQSLNDNILNGPRLQPELLDHLLRFRLFKIAFTADVAKMYRQILINPNDKQFQLILWRSNLSDEIKTFSLNTVTFGTTSAPYLAVKTLFRLSDDEEHNYPIGAKCLRNGFYVDDLIYGTDSVEEGLEVQTQTTMILKSAGFHLRKWSSNSEQILNQVPESDRESKTLLDFENKSSVKTLGVQWSPIDDDFHFKIELAPSTVFCKRSVLSDIAKIFDPLGWVSPCLIKAKMLIQILWSESRDWDEPLSSKSLEEWQSIRESLCHISQAIKIPRWLQTTKEGEIEVHAFSDASQKAYAGVVYVKTSFNGEVHVNLLFSKTKVAPLKQVTLPRLELMAAVLVVKMVNHLKSVSGFQNASYYFWSDSQITLAWIKDEPQKRVVFVANRITEIQSLSCPRDWRYVESKKNPADLGTRGVSASELVNLDLWWHGPEFIRDFKSQNEIENSEQVILPNEENKKQSTKTKNVSIIHTFLSHRKPKFNEVASNLIHFSTEAFNKFSTLNKLVRVVAYCLRIKKQNRPKHIFISPKEFEKALVSILKLVQMEVYSKELKDIQSDGLSTSSSLYPLNPFINSEDGLLRVSGRLENAQHLNYDQKHPVILPYLHALSRLIVSNAHLKTLHGTEQQTYMLISQRFHIIRCKCLIKCVIDKCVKCFRYRCAVQKQLMGQLPRYRITPNRPFLNCGVDFAGPFETKKFKGRCNSFYKSYFAIFVCFSTKAVHIEVVIDLSSVSFVAAYRRFISRRGAVQNLHSDCGTNFIGSQGVITRKMSAVESEWNENMARELAQFHTEWHFNPPGTPHFGGLWEAGVKSCKRHLKRVVGETRLTYDEFETVLVQIEACLNSRPLCRVNDSQNTIVLTPAHFLIQDSLLSLPDNNLESKNIAPVDRWGLLQKMLQDFWKLWSMEYLNTLRQRLKWKETVKNLNIGDVVIILEKNLPPSCWLLAKVLEIHPGQDGLVRIVTLKTKNNILKRPVVKLCPLPIQSDV